MLVEEGQPAAAAQAVQSKRGRSQGREAPRNEGEAPRNEGSLDAQAERRLPGTHVRDWIRGELVRAPPLHPFLSRASGSTGSTSSRWSQAGGASPEVLLYPSSENATETAVNAKFADLAAMENDVAAEFAE